MSLLDTVFGRPLASREEEQQRVGPLAGVPMLGLDALASAAYGPEAALTVLLVLGAAGLAYIGPLIGLIIALLVIVYSSYRQTIAAYPQGGGSYTVAKDNLGTGAGLLAAAALLLDYVLVVAIGISAGVGALVSALPALQPYTLPICLITLALIAVVNLRGVRESGLAFAVPTYLFIACMGIVLLIGLVKLLVGGGAVAPVVAPAPLEPGGAPASLWLLMMAFASGCTALTGVEAISNGVQAFREPRVRNARRTLTIVIVTLAVLLLGVGLLSQAYGIGATEPGRPGYESVLSQLVGAVVGKGAFYYLCIGAILGVLALSANTGFADFPRLCQIIALDNFLPHAFASRGRRLVYSHGIVVLTVLAGLLLIIFGGVTDHLIPLFAVGAFLAFTLSQAGMVVHWRRAGGPGAAWRLALNGFGAGATGITLLVVLIAKFTAGAWITVLVLPALLIVFVAVRRHYTHVLAETTCRAPLDVSDLQQPLVVVPIQRWNMQAHKALRFALKLSPNCYAVQVATHEEREQLAEQWSALVEAPARAAGLTPPRLLVRESPYRRVIRPLLATVDELMREHPNRQIAVIVPELVEQRWYHYLLHNQRAQVLKALLLLRGGPRIVIITVPWYLHN